MATSTTAQYAREAALQAFGIGTDGAAGATDRLLVDVLEEIREQVFVTNTEGTILYANRATEQITGYTQSELVGATPALWSDQMTDEHYCTLWRTISEQKETRHEMVRGRRKDGAAYDAEVTIIPAKDAQGVVQWYIGVERDVSDARRLERAKREFITLASHNLKTPLTSIRWYAEMLRDGDVGKLSPAQREYTDEIVGGVERMTILISQWLTISRMDLGLYTFDREAVPVHEVVDVVRTQLEARAQSQGVTLDFTPLATPCVMMGDREGLRVVVHSLVHNAIKYNRSGGTVTIKVATLPAREPWDGRTFPDVRMALAVSDTGVGIPVEEQHRIFEQFFRASNTGNLPGEGAGLGLFLSRELVRLFGGDIWFNSSEQGTCFFVTLPSGIDERQTGTPAAPTTPSPSLSV